MADGLSTFARQLLIDPDAYRELQHPLLVWSLTDEGKDSEVLLGTMAGVSRMRPTVGEPVVLPVRKADKVANAFAMGVTVGRTDSNDLVIPDNSVSRFHAYFQRDAKTGQWKVVDAESTYGTWVGAVKLLPNRAEPVPDRARLRFGQVEVAFYLPEAFVSYVKAMGMK